ncbi:hypothetical protein B0I37DRAFT_448490 [Chaetomium sp. MPI-CAGE-AT-0009]|nr:hypothetical protein B0I37DRAFT_448490 [Chaetomium sp. MPI-CAGE-AT-0009]
MSPWLHLTRVRCLVQPRLFQSRFLSSQSSIEHVRVPCASAGDITVSLHNINNHDTSSPLVILIPPVSQPRPDSVAPIPACFHDYPTAVINYRWQSYDEDKRPAIPLHWPTPLHDVNFGYSWIMDNLGSGTGLATKPRPAYVYGSYLGASLAAGLALTESHLPARSRPMTIRGLIAHNGIYNWTMFLPDHPIHKLKLKPRPNGKNRGFPLPLPTINDDPIEEEGIFTDLKDHAPALFVDPSNLFDPFASACLFFHSPELYVPDDFTTPLTATDGLSPAFNAAIDALANREPSPSPSSPPSSTSSSPSSTATSSSSSSESESASDSEPEEEAQEEESAAAILARAALLAKQRKPARKSYLVFPPRGGTLRLPSTLLIHSAPTQPQDNKNRGSNNFAVQANQLAGLMMRSLDMYEFGHRPGEVVGWEWEGEEATVGGGGERKGERWNAIERREEEGELGLDGKGEVVVGEWLREKIDEDAGGEGSGWERNAVEGL